MNSERTTTTGVHDRASQVAFGLLLTGALAIAFAPTLVKLADVGPAAIGFWRLALAAPVFWVLVGLQQRSAKAHNKPAMRRDYFWPVLAGFFFAGDLAVWHRALGLTSAANATLLANLAPILVSLAAWLWLKERFGILFILGLVLALIGAALVMGASLDLSTERLFGDVLGLATAFFYGGYQLSVKRARASFSTAVVMAVSATTASIVLAVIAWATGEQFLPGSLRGWMVVLAIAWFCHSTGQGLIAYALGHLPASFSSVTLLSQPVMAALIAWAILNESLVPGQAIGGILVLAGIFLARRSSTLAG